jgi:hypothetical protein
VAVAKGAAASTSTLTLIKGALKIMAWSKMKTAAVAGVAILLAAGTTTGVVKTIHAIRAASPPDIQGSWEGVAEILGTSGVLQGEKARSRVVFNFFKTNSAYTATGVFIDTAPDPFQVTKFTYDYPRSRSLPTTIPPCDLPWAKILSSRGSCGRGQRKLPPRSGGETCSRRCC